MNLDTPEQKHYGELNKQKAEEQKMPIVGLFSFHGFEFPEDVFKENPNLSYKLSKLTYIDMNIINMAQARKDEIKFKFGTAEYIHYRSGGMSKDEVNRDLFNDYLELGSLEGLDNTLIQTWVNLEEKSWWRRSFDNEDMAEQIKNKMKTTFDGRIGDIHWKESEDRRKISKQYNNN